jgi:1-phosphofructokinase family hexose kinase
MITVGLCPSWDRVCQFDGIEWGEHKLVSASTIRPAGKAMNISHALAWLGQKNIAAGLWGQDDHAMLLRAMRPLRKLIDVKVTAIEGSTRQNVTVVDVKNQREMHLRHRCELATRKALRRLRTDLKRIVRPDSVCVFAGLMPDAEYLSDVMKIVRDCAEAGAKIVLDTSGEALRTIVDTGLVWLVKPNVEELSELLDEPVDDKASALAKAASRLLDRAQIVLVSRGKKGAIAVARHGAWQGRCIGNRRVQATVGCGDYLLAGFLKGLLDTSDMAGALQTGVRVGTAKAWGWTEERDWGMVRREIHAVVRTMGTPGRVWPGSLGDQQGVSRCVSRVPIRRPDASSA